MIDDGSSAEPGLPRKLVFGALARTVYRRLEWLELPLSTVHPEIDARVALDVGFVGPAQADEIAAFRSGLSGTEVRDRFARGDRCFGSRYDGRLASISWVARAVARIEYLGLAVRLAPGTVYQYDRWTHPQLRGLRIAPATGSRLCRVLASEGFGLMAVAVLAENRVAMENALRVGLRPAGTIGWVGVGSLRRPFHRSG